MVTKSGFDGPFGFCNVAALKYTTGVYDGRHPTHGMSDMY
jgi:hypothetical protein